MMKKACLLLLFIQYVGLLLAQPPKTKELEMPKVPAMRMLNHDYIDKMQGGVVG